MDFRVQRLEGNSNCIVFHSPVLLSKYGSQRTFHFRAPVGGTEDVRRDLGLIGSVGETLVRATCQIDGVDEVFVDQHRITAILRRNGNLSWDTTLLSKIGSAFGEVFSGQAVAFVLEEESSTHQQA